MVAALKSRIKPLAVSMAHRFGPHRQAAKAPKLWILMYHRVLPQDDPRFAEEEPGMLVQPDTLRMHLQEAKKYFDLMPLHQWLARKNAGEPLPAKACAITFDDGWLDNYEYALPLLKELQVPATLFAVAEKTGTAFQFWPNLVTKLLLQGEAPQMARHPLFAPIFAELPQLFGKPNAELLAEAIRRLKRYVDHDIFAALGDLNWPALLGSMKPALMNWQQLRDLQDSGWVEIGSHTCNHKRLTDALSPEELEHEILGSRAYLEEHLHKPVNLFCFPNGDYSPQALNLVERGYTGAVTTRRGIVDAHQAPHQLTRIGLHDHVSQSPRQFGARLSAWL